MGTDAGRSFPQFILFICFLRSVGIFLIRSLSRAALRSESTKTLLFGRIHIKQTPERAGQGDRPGMINLRGNEFLKSKGKRDLPAEPSTCKTEHSDF